MHKEELKEHATQLKVPYAVHFTRAENLESIIAHGIYPISRIDELGIPAQVNDELRLDGRRNGISISVAFPNCKMLYKYRMENQGSEWVILILQPSILWTKDCAFCKHNAADARISNLPLASLNTVSAFQAMFEEIEGHVSRTEQNLKSFDPTDVQAEVLLFDPIEPALIECVVFDSTATKTKYVGVVGGRKTWVDANNKRLFASRNYVRKYQVTW